jgi:hypothetical protein
MDAAAARRGSPLKIVQSVADLEAESDGSQTEDALSDTPSLTRLSDKGKKRALPETWEPPYLPEERVVTLKKEADRCRKRALKARFLDNWHTARMNKLARKEEERERHHTAQQQSIQYTARVRAESSRGRSETPSSIRDRSVSVDPTRKWKRKRVSGEFRNPVSDADLAERLREVMVSQQLIHYMLTFSLQNHVEHAARWAPGTFLASIRSHVGVWPAAWEVWLSLNPKNDNTAVWVEKKFDMPMSGDWVSETVFAIREGDHDHPCPGLLFFECTPGEGHDTIEQ